MDKQQFIKTRQAVADLQAELKNLKQAAESKKYALTQQRQSYKHNMAERNLRLENLGYSTWVNLSICSSPPRIFKLTDKTYTSFVKISRQLSGNFTKSLNVVISGRDPRVSSNVRKCSGV